MNERFHRLIAPAMFTMDFTSIIRYYGESHQQEHSIRRFLKAVINQYKLPYIPSIGWFCFNLFGYSILCAVFFVMFHPKCGTQKDNDQHERGEHVSLKFSRFMTKTIVGPLKIIIFPALLITAVEFKFRNRYPPNQSKPWDDWCNHYHFIFLYILGYTIMAVDQTLLNAIMAKYGKMYLFIGTTLVCSEMPKLPHPKRSNPFCSSKNYDETFMYIIAGFGEWMFMIGLYATLKNIYTKDIKVVIFLRKIMMPFYMTHLSVLAWVTGAIEHSSMFDKGHPEFAFATNIILTTILTVIISFTISKLPSLVGYCFGLPSWNKNTTKKVEYIPITLLIIGRWYGYEIVKKDYI